MRGMGLGRGIFWICALAGALLAQPKRVHAQSGGSAGGGASQAGPQSADLAAVDKLLQQLQSQIVELNGQVKALQAKQESAQAESAKLREELEATKAQLVALSGQPGAVAPATIGRYVAGVQGPAAERIARLEENQQLSDQKATEQSQTKVESSSKYRLRLSGIVLFNLFANRGSVDNQDFPTLATAPGILSSDGTFGGSLRQSQIGLQGFGPTVGGARTSADLQFDFAGGFPNAPNGTSFGIVRLRTGTVRFDWDKTSVIAGQDSLFLAPLSPTSIATLAIPAFAYSGNLWTWTPQVRVEHHFALTENSSLLLQGGILDSFNADKPPAQFYRDFTWGENSGQPAYATRLAWTHALEGQNLIAGVGGYYSRQNWGFGRSIDSWAGTLDLTLPLGSKFEFTGQFYRGRGIGGLGGGIAQTALWVGSLADPATDVYGLDAMGGWAQVKYKATSKLQFNGAYGQDAPFANKLRQLGGSQNYYPVPLSKNWTAMGNFLYQPKSDIVFSLEYRRLKTYTLDSTANSANIIDLSVGYIF